MSAASTGSLRRQQPSVRRLALVLWVALAAVTGASADTVVGHIEGAADVTAAGAATYTMPIQVAAGLGGLRPDVALAYNSHAGDGPAGNGWTLTGFPRVTRCGRTFALDGRVQGVRFSSQDRFCLDGQPLLLVTGAWGASGAEYRREIHANERIFSYGRQGSSPAWFEVRHPDGRIERFGNDADSRIEVPGGSEVAVWAINEIVDRSGQRIGVTWFEDNARGEHHPTEIRWSYGASADPQQAPLRLAFEWEDRPADDVREGFVWGAPWQTSVRLSAIAYEANGGTGLQLVHRYTLAYRAVRIGAGDRQLLASVTQCGPKDCLPPTTFDWYPTTGEHVVEQSSGPNTANALIGDYNGDGALDLFGLNGAYWSVWPGDPQNGGYGSPVSVGRRETTQPDIAVPFDYNGDGLTDLLIAGVNGLGLVYFAPTGEPAAPGPGFPWRYLPGLSPALMEIQPMDVDGDHLDDLVYLRNGAVYFRRNLGGDLGPEQAGGLRSVTAPYTPFLNGNGYIQPADFDGDGRMDLLVARSKATATGDYRWEAFLSTGTRFATDPIASFTTQPSPHKALVADLNGDGLSDVLRYSGSVWRSYLSRGTGTSSNPGLVDQNCPAAPTMEGTHPVVLDYDGDGRSDLLTDLSGTNWYVYPSRAGCLDQGRQYEITALPQVRTMFKVVLPTDVNGDGNIDLVAGVDDGSQTSTWFSVRYEPRNGLSHLFERAGLLRTLTDGLGNESHFSYAALSGWSGYSATAQAPAGTRLVRGGPLAVVSIHSESSGIGDTLTYTGFSYANALFDRLGRGLLGFATVRVSDGTTRLTTETRYHQVFPYIGRVDQVTVRNGNQTVSVYDPTWSAAVTSVPDAARDVHFVRLTGDVDERYEIDAEGLYAGNVVRRTTRSLTWDLSHGAVATEQVVVTAPQEGDIPHRTTRTTSFDDGAGEEAGCLGLPTQVIVTRDVAGSLSESRTTQRSWNTATCQLASQVDGPPASASQQLRATYAYDAQGRTTTVTLQDAAGQLPPRQTRYEYAPGDPQPIAESALITGESDLTVTHTWHPGLGLVTARVNPQGRPSSWTYDDFGRLLRESRSPGSTQYSYTACGPCFAPNARYAVRLVRSDGSWTESQHDSRGRIVGRSSELPDGRISRQLLEYEATGRLARQSTPFVDGAAQVYWTTYQYDRLGRPKSIDQPASEEVPSGASYNYVYAGLVTVRGNPEEHFTIQRHDAEGRLVFVRGPLMDDTNYGYTAFGQLRTVTDPAGHRRELHYDERGLLVESIDPDSGRRRFAYDAFGALVSRTDGDATAVTATWQYDQLGRLTRRTEPEGVTSFTYSPAAGSGRGLLTLVTAASGFREAYVYDTNSRLQQITTTIEGVAYQTDYGYDSENNVRSMIYPATVGWRPRFLFGYTAGHLTAVVQQDIGFTPVSLLMGTDASGRPTRLAFADGGIVEEARYDAASGRLRSIRSGVPDAPGSLQDYTYTWDRVGNLLSREDLGASPHRRETFTYDADNRLTQVTLDGTTTVTARYTIDGNLLSRSDVGTYAYTGTQPHAVTRVSGGPAGTLDFAYDASGQMSSRNGSGITWTSSGQPTRISAGSNFTQFAYGPSGQRVRQLSRAGGVARTTHYVGPHFEVEIEGGVRRYRSTVFGYGRALYSQVESSAGGIEAYYVLHDHQGSVDRLARSAGTGTDEIALGFDAWGRRRNADWSADPAGARYGDRHWTERGYTGHEHIDPVRLVHMNGRVQDPLLGRMLSPDPVLGALEQPQTQNAYGYAANNPVTYIDPSGYFLGRIGNFLQRGVRHLGSFGRRVIRRWGRPIVAAVTAYYTAGAVSSWAYAAQGSSLTAATIGSAQLTSYVVGGMAGGAVAGAISTGELRGALVGAVTGAAMGGITGYWGGSYSAGRVLAEASVGGVAAELNGGDFRQGFLTSGSFSSLTWAAVEMREAMIKQSMLNPENARGVSAGFRGDRFKLGGSRWPSDSSVLGGAQGGRGNFFGLSYKPGSFLDHLIETYAGPHDFLNSPVFYNEMGNNAGRWIGLEAINAANVVLATPFAAASALPSLAYPAFVN